MSPKHKDHVENSMGNEREATEAAGGWAQRGGAGNRGARGRIPLGFGKRSVCPRRPCTSSEPRAPQTSRESSSLLVSESTFSLFNLVASQEGWAGEGAFHTCSPGLLSKRFTHTSLLSLPKSHYCRAGGVSPAFVT